jgi:outer membrane protein assembly factor BamB
MTPKEKVHPVHCNFVVRYNCVHVHAAIWSSANEEQKKKCFAASKISGPPRLLAGRIYFGACNDIVYELDPSTAENHRHTSNFGCSHKRADP